MDIWKNKLEKFNFFILTSLDLLRNCLQTALLYDSFFPNTFSYHLLRKHVKWSYYNQSLVKRGEILLGFDVIDNWKTELKEMNKDKVGLGTISSSQYISSFPGVCQSNFIYHASRLKKVFTWTDKGKVPDIPDYNTYHKQKNKQTEYQDGK